MRIVENAKRRTSRYKQKELVVTRVLSLLFTCVSILQARLHDKVSCSSWNSK